MQKASPQARAWIAAPEIIASLARPYSPSTFINRIIFVDFFELARPGVAAYLEGREIATGTEVARAIGRSYSTMTPDSWRALARVVLSCGWKSKRIEGLPVWVAPRCAATRYVRNARRAATHMREEHRHPPANGHSAPVNLRV
jgi:hypothetical protein